MTSYSSCVLKLTAVCNLNCTYCYVFNLADRVHTRVPPLLPVDTSLRVLERIVEHARSSGQTEFRLVLHGGEPTMWPRRNFITFLDHVETIRQRGIALNVSMQTNAYKIDNALVSLLSDHRVSLGISIDGPPEINDAFRKNHAGRGSYLQVMATVSRIIDAGFRDMLGGFLTVCQPETEPEIFLQWAEGLPVRRLDVLWPIQVHHANPPWAGLNQADYARTPRYGTWFARLFDLWWRRDDPDLYVRHFFEIIESMLGSRTHSDALVNDRLPMFVVNTDGGIEYPDYFRAYSDGGSRTPFNVFDHTLNDTLGDSGFEYCLALGQHLPAECRSCDEVGLCGGGFLPGRAMPGEWPPRRKSILCYDQLYFFSKVRSIVGPLLARPKELA